MVRPGWNVTRSVSWNRLKLCAFNLSICFPLHLFFAAFQACSLDLYARRLNPLLSLFQIPGTLCVVTDSWGNKSLPLVVQRRLGRGRAVLLCHWVNHLLEADFAPS